MSQARNRHGRTEFTGVPHKLPCPFGGDVVAV